MTHRIGVDIGGTFTDFALGHDETGEVVVHKQLTTPDDLAKSVLSGVEKLLADAGVDFGLVESIVHGSTLVANAVIENKGAKAGMLVTKGFRDVLDIAHERRYDLYDLRLRFPKPLVPRNLRCEVNERLREDGLVLKPVDLEEVRESVEKLVDEHQIQSLAICFLHSFTNSVHERTVSEYLKSEFPHLYISSSFEIFPFAREYARWTSATVNAFVQPLVDGYLTRLEQGLGTRGFNGDLYIMMSNGGSATIETAREFPVRMLESGPAAGVLMSAFQGRRLDVNQVLSFDMGGTTAKGAIIRNGRPRKVYELEVARVHNFKSGSGLPVKLPVIDMIEIGAGGGSIAGIDSRGTIQVGPQSAGAKPGPACYELGGENATLTDANVALGYFDPDFFLGGRMKLNISSAEKAVTADIAEPLGIEKLEAAWGIHEVINEDVARAFRIHASENGFDYRNCSMVAFGGSGPAHAMRVAKKLKIPKVIFPAGSGVMSAIGMLVTPMSFQVARTQRILYSDLNEKQFVATFNSLEDEASEPLLRAGVSKDSIDVLRHLDIRYRGQGHELEVGLSQGIDLAELYSEIPRLFAEEYNSIFSLSYVDQPIEIVNWKVEMIGPEPSLNTNFSVSRRAGVGDAQKGSRAAYFPEAGGLVETPVYDRYALMPGTTLVGPALIEERDSTYVIGPGDKVVVDKFANIVAEIGETDDQQVKISANSSENFDQIGLGILWDRAISIADEIVNSLVRTSFSTIARENLDLACILFDAKGRSLAQGTFSVPVFIGTAPMTIVHMLKRFPPETLRPCDVIITNDIWMGTGHLWDINVLQPAFKNGVLVGFAMSISHLPDIGGRGMSALNATMFEEGLQIPICKLLDGGVLDDRLVEIIKKNVRVPEQVIGDLMANVAATNVGCRQLIEFMEEYGISELSRLSSAIIEQSERAMRDRISATPDGIYRNSIQVEALDDCVELSCAVTISGDRLSIDFDGTSAQVGAALNVPFCYTRAMAAYSIKCLLLPNIPNNEGSVTPVEVHAPEGCILNAQPPSATGSRLLVGHFVAPLVFGALADAVPGMVQADPGMMNILNVIGQRRDNQEYTMLYFSAGGLGAMDGQDGAATTPAPSNMMGMPTEIWEPLTHMRVEYRRLREDSGGAGQFRGGLGQVVALRNETGNPIVVFGIGMRSQFPASGLNGGHSGAVRTYRINGVEVSTTGQHVLKPNDVIEISDAGGGGYGDPKNREDHKICDDFIEGFISLDTMTHTYERDESTSKA